jgi:uncharacterized damage-inducible protein DinB
MDATLKPWVELWDYLDGNFWHVWEWADDHLTPEQVAWQPIATVASIGWNLQHLGEMLDYYLTHVFGQSGPVHMDLRTMRSGSQDDGRFGNLAAIATYHKQLRPAYRRFLASLSASDLDRVIERRGRRSITYTWAIGHVAEHESYHLGKCTLLRSLIIAARSKNG